MLSWLIKMCFVTGLNFDFLRTSLKLLVFALTNKLNSSRSLSNFILIFANNSNPWSYNFCNPFNSRSVNIKKNNNFADSWWMSLDLLGWHSLEHAPHWILSSEMFVVITVRPFLTNERFKAQQFHELTLSNGTATFEIFVCDLSQCYNVIKQKTPRNVHASRKSVKIFANNSNDSKF